MTDLAGKTLFITGASRGIGLAIARRAARDGARVVIAAKTAEANPKLPGTIHSAAAEIEAAGGQALAVQCDIRDDDSVAAAVQQAVERFGGIDILVNNASAISLTATPETPMKRFDLMFGVNVRGTYLCTQTCLPHLQRRGDGRAQPARPEHGAAAVDEAALVRASHGLHHGQVRHEHVHARPCGGIQALRHRGQQPLAAHRDRDRRAADDPRGGPRPLSQARDPRRCGLPRPHQRRRARLPAISSSTTLLLATTASPTSSPTA